MSSVDYRVTGPRVLIPGNEVDIGLQVRLNRNGFVAVDLGMGADPVVFTAAVVAAEQKGLPGWRFRKEYKRDWLAVSGQPVFQPAWLDWQVPSIREPAYTMDLDRKGRLVRFEELPADTRSRLGRGRLRVFVGPDDRPEDIPPGSSGAVRGFGAGADVSEGVGASDSTIEVFTSDTREEAASFADPNITPAQLGRFLARVCRYYRDALACPVRKLHGLTVLRTMIDEEKYYRIWHSRTATRATELRAADLGWPKGESSSPYLFGGWCSALERAEVMLHDQITLDQHRQYIYDDHGRATQQAMAHLPPEVRERHGDRVIGCCLALRAVKDLPRFAEVKPPPPPHPTSIAGLEAAEQAAQARRRRW